MTQDGVTATGSNEAPSFAAVLARLEAAASPVDEHDFLQALRAAERSPDSVGGVPLEAEIIAFMVYADERPEGSSWGCYFGPMMSGIDPSGAPWDEPPVSAITPGVREYWARRARESSHPVMRARYADLLWEMPKRIKGMTPDASMARIAIDSYVMATEGRRFRHAGVAVNRARRALNLSLQIGDRDRAERVRDLILSLDDGSASDEDLGLWGFAFDLFVGPERVRVAISELEIKTIVDRLEERLARMAAANSPLVYHPSAAEAATTRLAGHYRRVKREADVTRVLDLYAGIVKRMQSPAAAMVRSHSLERLRSLYLSFGRRAEADAVEPLLRRSAETAMDEMKTLSVELEIDSAKVDLWLSQILTASWEIAIARLAAAFLPRKEQLTQEVLSLAKDAPLVYLMPHHVTDGLGRRVASIGPIERDLEGHVVRHVAHHLSLSAPFLREAFTRGRSGVLTAGALIDFILASPLFPPDRRTLIEHGLRAHDIGDQIAALHILVPQIEAGVRNLALALERPIYGTSRDGGLELKLLHPLLRDSGVQGALGADIEHYLRVLLVDPRGWNLRNDVAHGLLSARAITTALADRAVHALLLLGMFRRNEEKPVEPKGPDA